MRAQAALLLAPYIGRTLTPEVASGLIASFPRGGQPFDLSTLPRWERGRMVYAAERGADILPELEVLHRAQWAETERYMDQPMDPAVDECLLDEAEGRLVQLTARADGVLVGHMRMYVMRSRHTRKRIASEDTMYLLPEFRAGRNALRLLEFMEACMAALGVTGIYLDDKVANPAAGRLLDFMNYPTIANRRFKSLEAPHVRT